MIFGMELIDKVLEGDKTVTRRKHPSKYTPGQYLKIQPGMARRSVGTIYIVSVTPVWLEEMSEAEARLEGFDNAEEFYEYWAMLYPRTPVEGVRVDRIEFECTERTGTPCDRCNGHGFLNHPDTYEGIAR